jgi:hypothetical protein
MAGLGYKLFASGEVLTAGNLQGYGIDQSVMVFASAAERTTDLAAPSQGMVSFLFDTGTTWQYFELYNASTNPGGAKTAGWYPVGGQAIFYGTASRTFATGVTYTIGASGFAFTEISDVLGWHQPVTNPERLTPSIEGIYRVSAYLSLGGSGAGGQNKSVLKNGSTILVFGGLNSNYGATNNITQMVSMNGSTDYLTFTALQDSGVNMTAAAYVTLEFVRPLST